jgi:hypothetical protein
MRRSGSLHMRRLHKSVRGADQSALFSTSTVDANGHPRAIALESVTMRAEPFSLSSEGYFSPGDPRTRVTLFCMNRAFVLMQYYGYLRRNPNDPPETNLDYSGYDFWLKKLTAFQGNYVNAQMVQAFLDSSDYRQRFGPP